MGDARFAPADTELTLHGAIGGSFGLTAAATTGFNGSGVLRVNGANTYTGPTNVESGTLFVNGSIAAASAVNVTGGILGGTGTINGTATISGVGTLAPGEGKGILTIAGDLTMNAGSTFSLEIAHAGAGDPVAGTDYDRLVVGVGSDATSTGQVNLSGANLALVLGQGIRQNDLFFVLNNDGLDAILGTFQGRPDDSVFAVGNQSFMISYDADLATNSLSGGNDIALLAIPEPVTTSFLLVGALGLLSRRRRQSGRL